MDESGMVVTLLDGPFDGTTYPFPPGSLLPLLLPHDGQYYCYDSFEDPDREFDDPIRLRWRGAPIEMADLKRFLTDEYGIQFDA